MRRQPATTAWLPWSNACQSHEGFPLGTDLGVGSEGRREEVSSLKPPNWILLPQLPPQHPSFLAFSRARAWCPPFKCKELRPAPWGHSGAGVVLENNVAVPARTGKIGVAPREGALSVIVPNVWLPRRREAPGCVRAGRSWLLQPICPAGQGVGSPKLWCPSGLPGPYSLNWPFYSCPWPYWVESRFRPLTLQFFLSVIQDLKCLIHPRKSGQTGLERANLPPKLP